MRRRTKTYLLGLTTGVIVMTLVLTAVYYYFSYLPFNETIANYKLLLENYQNPAMVEVVKLARDLRQYDIVAEDDFEIVKMPIKYDSEALFDAGAQLIGLTASSDLKAGTLLHKNMVYSAKALPKDLRVYQIGNLLTQSYLQIGDSVDVRISFPSGLDYIVLSKKVLIDKMPASEEQPLELCVFHLNEDEILRLSSAIVDAYINEGAYLYTTLYVSGSSQMAAEVTYPANPAVMALIEQDPNIVTRATVALEIQKRQQLTRSLMGLPDELIASPETTAATEEATEQAATPDAEQGAAAALDDGTLQENDVNDEVQ